MTGSPIPAPTTEQPHPPAPTPDPTLPPPPAPAPAPQLDPAPKSFTQDDVTAIAAREAAEARRQAMREVSEKLGCSVEEAEQHLKDARTAELNKMSEADRKTAEAVERERVAAEREAAATLREQRLRVREVLVGAGVRPERATRASEDIVVAADADDAAVLAAVEAYKLEVPEFFTSAAPTPPPPKTTPTSTPTSPPPPTGKPEEDRYAKGAERAKSHVPSV